MLRWSALLWEGENGQVVSRAGAAQGAARGSRAHQVLGVKVASSPGGTLALMLSLAGSLALEVPGLLDLAMDGLRSECAASGQQPGGHGPRRHVCSAPWCVVVALWCLGGRSNIEPRWPPC